MLDNDHQHQTNINQHTTYKREHEMAVANANFGVGSI